MGTYSLRVHRELAISDLDHKMNDPSSEIPSLVLDVKKEEIDRRVVLQASDQTAQAGLRRSAFELLVSCGPMTPAQIWILAAMDPS
jgi:hypothetical protein